VPNESFQCAALTLSSTSKILRKKAAWRVNSVKPSKVFALTMFWAKSALKSGIILVHARGFVFAAPEVVLIEVTDEQPCPVARISAETAQDKETPTYQTYFP
jgi:hypothetical protein